MLSKMFDIKGEKELGLVEDFRSLGVMSAGPFYFLFTSWPPWGTHLCLQPHYHPSRPHKLCLQYLSQSFL